MPDARFRGEIRHRCLSLSGADSISVIISVALTGDYEYPTLYETGPDTGVFESSIDLALSAVADEFNELLETTESAGPPHAFDTLTASHLGPSGPSSATAATIGSRTRWIDAAGEAVSSFDEGSNPGHPLAAGLSGLVSIVPGTTVLRWGVPGAAAEVAAVAEGDPGKALIFGYRAGVPQRRRLGAVRRRGGLGGRGTVRT